MDVTGINDPSVLLHMDLPLVMDLMKAKIKLEESKSKAQKAAREMQQMMKGGGGMF